MMGWEPLFCLFFATVGWGWVKFLLDACRAQDRYDEAVAEAIHWKRHFEENVAHEWTFYDGQGY